MGNSNTPEPISFSKKILFIPCLEEVGIPIAELGYIHVEPEIYNNRYGVTWIERGQKLFTYEFKAFEYPTSNIFERITGNQAMTSNTWEIVSPVSGLMIHARDELASSMGAANLLYHGMSKQILPVFLIPNAESIPDTNNFSIYNGISSWLKSYFNKLPIRSNERTRPYRLRNHREKYPSAEKSYSEIFKILENRNDRKFYSYNIREINSDDYHIIRGIENARKLHMDLRVKLNDIFLEFGDSI